MFEDVQETMDEVLELWERMKESNEEDSESDANRFQMMFYVLMEHIRAWIRVLDEPPKDVEEAQTEPRFARLFDAMPEPLQIPFEMELESILTNRKTDIDSTEQG